MFSWRVECGVWSEKCLAAESPLGVFSLHTPHSTLLEKKSLLLLALLLLPLIVQARSIPAISRDKAREAAREQVVWRGRLCPLSTAARDFLTAVYGKPTYKGLTPEQVIYGWRLRPDVWKEEPMIRIGDARLRRQLHIEGDIAAFSQLFDDTLGYRLSLLGADLPERMRPLVRESPAVVALDERVGMIILLAQGRLFQPRPADMPPLSPWRVEAEILWNRMPLWVILLIPVAAGLAGLVVWGRRRRAGRQQADSRLPVSARRDGESRQ